MRMNGMIDLGRATREEAADAHATRPPRGGCPSPFRPRRRRTAIRTGPGPAPGPCPLKRIGKIGKIQN